MATQDEISMQSVEGTRTWPLRRVGLKVQDLSACLDYYMRLGFSVVRDEKDKDAEGTIGLGTGSQEILSLRVLHGGRPRPAHTAGLYHFAILVPDEVELGSFLQNSLEHGIHIAGASDHLVSQAIYLSDPEGNGIEVYADRPREQWHWKGGHVDMATLPVDAPALLKQARPFDGFSSQTSLGHMHLNVGDLDRSMAYYQDLGMELTADVYHQARFLSWDGYHHHLGINLWAGRNASRLEPGVYGLDFFELSRPGLKPGTFEDPDGVKVVITKS